MSADIMVASADGFELAAYRSDSSGNSLGGVVIVHEIFGVNSHIRSVCDTFASAGFTAIAPALFDRQKRDIELSYEDDDRERGRSFMQRADVRVAVDDIGAAAAAVNSVGNVAVVGYCWGGTMAWLAAARIQELAAAVCYYGPGIGKYLNDTPRCPVMLHFGDQDSMIPEEVRFRIQEAYPDVTMHLYPAGHGFNCDQRSSWNSEAANLAFERTVEFLRTRFTDS